jgi:hypothetical protein
MFKVQGSRFEVQRGQSQRQGLGQDFDVEAGAGKQFAVEVNIDEVVADDSHFFGLPV